VKELGHFEKPVPPPEPEPVEVVVEEFEEEVKNEVIDDFSDMEEVPLNRTSERSSFNPYAPKKSDSKNSSFLSMDGYQKYWSGMFNW
jgi:hypothetical protein